MVEPNIQAIGKEVDNLIIAIGKQHIVALKFSPDGKHLVAATTDGCLNLWTTGGGERRVLRSGCEGPVQQMAFAPDSSRISIATANGPVMLLDLHGEQSRPRALPSADRATSLAFSPDGEQLAIGAPDGTVRVCDLRSPQKPLVLAGLKAL